MKFAFPTLLGALLGLASMSSFASAATVVQWDFEAGTPGTHFNDAGGGGLNGSNSIVGDTLIRGWSNQFGANYSADRPLSGGNVSMNHNDFVGNTAGGAARGRDGYIFPELGVGSGASAIHNWSSPTFTIETTFKFTAIDGWHTLIGRDGSSSGGLLTVGDTNKSDFYLQRTGDGSNVIRFDYLTESNQRVILNGFTPTVDTWYAVALVGDGASVSMLYDDGVNGWQTATSTGLDINGAAITNTGIKSTGFNWTFGRGWYNNGFGDGVPGLQDNIRFSDTALTTSELIAVPEPSTGLAIAVVAGIGAWTRRRSAKAAKVA